MAEMIVGGLILVSIAGWVVVGVVAGVWGLLQ